MNLTTEVENKADAATICDPSKLNWRKNASVSFRAVTGSHPESPAVSGTEAADLLLTQEQAWRLLTELPSHLAEMARFSLATGLRQRNVSYLQWDRVDTSRGVAWIHPGQAKAGRAVGVPLNQDALKVLGERLGKHKVYVFTFQGKRQVCEPVFDEAWKMAFARAGIGSGFRWHDLRHTRASWHVQSGTRLQELTELGENCDWSTVDK